MPTKEEIITKHRAIHKELKEDHYKKHLMSKEDFDFLHGQNWADMETELIAEGYRKPPEPVRDAFAEIDKINEKLDLLLRK